MSGTFTRMRGVTLCEYLRLGTSCDWTERFELWQVGPENFVLSVLQIVSADTAANEIWLSGEARDGAALHRAFERWTEERRPDPAAAHAARVRVAATLREWLPTVGRQFADAPARDFDRSYGAASGRGD